jgi:tonB family C-terminal domain
VFTGKVYEIVEDMPTFPGGITELMNYLSKNTHYPASTKRDGIQGRVVVSFIVEPDGSISNAKLVRSIDANLDQEALRVVSEMPNWTPGKQGGNAVRVRYSLPIAFKL